MQHKREGGGGGGERRRTGKKEEEQEQKKKKKNKLKGSKQRAGPIRRKIERKNKKKNKGRRRRRKRREREREVGRKENKEDEELKSEERGLIMLKFDLSTRKQLNIKFVHIITSGMCSLVVKPIIHTLKVEGSNLTTCKID